MKRRELLEERNLERRDILKAAGAGAGAVGVLGIGAYSWTRSGQENSESPVPRPPENGEEPPNGQPSNGQPPSDDPPIDAIPHADDFSSIVETIETGLEPDMGEPVNFLFDEYSGDDTLLAFEPGTYQLDPIQLADTTHLGIVSSGEQPVRFVPTAGNCRGGNPYIFMNQVSDLVWENVTFDFTDSEAGGPIHLFLRGDSIIRDVTYQGTCSNQLGIMRVEVLDSSGSALFENLQASNIDENHTLTGVYVSGNHAGEATFRDCNLEEFSDNGLYASAPGGPNGNDGTVNVVGGVYRNNNIANVRLGSSGSVAEDVTVIVDSETPGWGQLNSRGIRLRNKSGQVIENCEITFEPEAAYSFGAIVFHKNNSGGLVRDSTIRLRRDEIPAIKAFPDANPGTGKPEFEDLVVAGNAAGGYTAEIEGRDETEFRNCTIVQPGSDRRGIRLLDCQNCRIVDSHVHVAEEPLILHNSSATVENTTFISEGGREYVEQRSYENETVTIS